MSIEAGEVEGRTAHVIPVPEGMTTEEAWAEIRLLGCLLTVNQQRPVAYWAVVLDDE